MGQFPYKKYEQLQKQREKANRYMQQSKENYQKSRYYSYEVYKPGNTAAQRSKNLEKAQSYYEKAQKQANQFMKAYQKANEYQRELLKPKPPKEVKPSQYERPKLPRFKNPYQTYSIYNPYQYPQGQSYERLEEKGGLAGYKSFYDYTQILQCYNATPLH